MINNLFFTNKLNNYNSNIELLNNIIDKYDITNIINNYNIKLETKQDIFNNTYSEQNRELKNFFTDVVIEHILDSDKLFNLLYLINTLYTTTINKYIVCNDLKDDDIIFIFKGGNVFKLIAEKFWMELPNQAMYKFISEYKPYFKKSDLDFSIYINPDLNIKVLTEITLISYHIQLVISDILYKNKNLFFKWFKYNKNYQKCLLNKLLIDLNKLTILKDENSIYYNKKFDKIDFNISNNYENQKNKYITFLNENEDITSLEDLDNNSIVSQNIKTTNNTEFMYTSINNALKIHTNNRVLEFNLTRTKINFNIYLNNNNLFIGGELIDVSIGHDVATEKFYKNKKKYLDTIQLNKNDESFNINIYSYNYLYNDLKFILFETVYFPWNDIKYGKRLYRIFYFTFIDLFINSKSIKNKNIQKILQYYTLICEIIKNFNNNTYNKTTINRISKLLSKKKFDTIINNIVCTKECLIYDLFKNINRIIEKVLYSRNLINLNIYNNIFINNNINNNRIQTNNEFEELLNLLNIVKLNLNNLLIVNEYILNYSKNVILFDYKCVNIDLLQ
jgi:hypothetical protein